MNRFGGKSLLRKTDEPESPPAGPSQEQLDLKAYLEAKYASKPKKKKKPKAATPSLRIVDNDVTGFAPVEETELKEIDPDAPVVVDMDEVAAVQEPQNKKEKTKRGGWHTVEVKTDKKGQEADMSPPRRTLYDAPNEAETEDAEDLSPPRRQKSEMTNAQADADLSPPRRRDRQQRCTPDEEDLSPPRRPSSHAHRASTGKHQMMDGTATGVVTAEQVKEEIRKKRRKDKEKLYGMDDHATGRGAETVHRTKDGRRMTQEELERQKAKEKKKVKWEKVEWDSGLVQQKNAKKLKAAFEREREKPFARARDDEDLDAMYKARRRWGDPMGHLNKKSKSSQQQLNTEFTPVIDETNRHWFEKSGFVIPQEVPPHSWIRRGAAPLSNRYNIRPGRHWDGVDRSNGFEKEYAKYLNECAAKDKEAAAWLMEDL